MVKAESETDDKVTLYPQWCKQCGICVALCPKKALASDQEGLPYLAHAELCNECGLCEMRCPDFAIAVSIRHDKSEEDD